MIRRAFAAPLVLTLAAAPACHHATAPAVQPPITNPPRQPPPDEPPADPPADEVPGKWVKGATGWAYEYADGRTVYVDDEGGCHVVFSASCGSAGGGPPDPTMTCNPPPPQDVACPPGRPGT